MHHPTTRRTLLLALATMPLFAGHASAAPALDHALARLKALEADSGGRLGVAALDTGNGAALLHRADERFPFCSSFKMMLAAAILDRSRRDPTLLARRVPIHKTDLVSHSPITKDFLAEGMTVDALCDATIRYSDNAAANLLIKILGGPGGVTAFARSIGDTAFRLDRWETMLNSAIPGDARDTTTPAAMMNSLRKLALGEALAAPGRALLVDWLKRNTTGDTRIRAGVPAGWIVGDKTGTGAYGTTNDIGVLWPPGRASIVVALYFTQPDENAEARSDVLAAATRIVVAALA
jgi:beta-lactamase class A